MLKCLPADVARQLEAQNNEGFPKIQAQLAAAISAADYPKVSFALQALNRHLALRLQIPRDDLQPIADVLYRISLQDDLGNSVNGKASKSLQNVLKHARKYNVPLRLAWRPLYEALRTQIGRLYHNTSSSQAFTGKLAEQYRITNLLALVSKASRCFSAQDALEITHELRGSLYPEDDNCLISMALLNLLLPTHRIETPQSPQALDYADWTRQVIAMWPWIENGEEWNTLILSHLASIAKGVRRGGGAAVDFAPYLPLLYTNFVRTFDVAVGTSKWPRPEKRRLPQEMAATLMRSHGHWGGASGAFIATIIVNIPPALDLLPKLMSTLQTYYHPSNSGPWTGGLAALLASLCSRYAKRVGKTPVEEREPSRDQLFIDAMLPIAMLAVYAKSDFLVRSARVALKHLIHIDSSGGVLDRLLNSVLVALDTVTSPHRALAGFEVLATTIGDAAGPRRPQGAGLLPTVLQLTLPGIDANDVEKTQAVFKIYYRLLSCVPMLPLEPPVMSDVDVPDTSVFFSEWSLMFLDRVFVFLSHKDKDQKDEQWWRQLFRATFRVLFMQASTEQHQAMLQKLLRYVQSNVYPNAVKEFGWMAESASYANPVAALKAWIPAVHTALIRIQNGVATLNPSLSDAKIAWHLRLLAGVTRYAGAAVHSYPHPINEILSASLYAEDGSTAKAAGRLFRRLLLGTTTNYPADYRSLPPDQWARQKVSLSQWGSAVDYSSLEIQWHTPSPDELRFASGLLTEQVNGAIGKIEAILNPLSAGSSEHVPKPPPGQLLKALMVLRNALRGASSLLPVTERRSDDGFYELDPTVASIYATVDVRNGIGSTLMELNVWLGNHRLDSIRDRKMFVKVVALWLQPSTHLGSYSRVRQFQRMIKDKYDDFATPRQDSISRRVRYSKIQSVYLMHQRRLEQANFGLELTERRRSMIDALWSFSCGSYAQLRKKAQALLVPALKRSVGGMSEFLPTMLRTLQLPTTDQPGENALNGAIFTLSSLPIMRRIVSEWRFVQAFIEGIGGSSHHKDIKFQLRLYQLFLVFAGCFYELPIEVRRLAPDSHSAALEALRLDEPPGSQIRHWSETNRQIYANTMWHLVRVIQEGRLHWRYRIAMHAFLAFLSRSSAHAAGTAAAAAGQQQQQEDAVLQLFLDGLASDLAPQRFLSVVGATSLLVHRKPPVPAALTGARATDRLIAAPATFEPIDSEAGWNGANFQDKNYFGYNGATRLPDGGPDRRDSGTAARAAQLVVQWAGQNGAAGVTLQAQDHKFKDTAEGQGGIAGRIRSLMQRFMQGGGMQSLEEQGADDIIRAIFSARLWPSTYPKVSTGVGFSLEHATLWQLFFRISGFQLMSVIHPHLASNLYGSSEKENLTAAAEVLMGMVRGSRRWPFSDVQQMWRYVGEVLPGLLERVTTELLPEWMSAIRFAMHHRDPRRFQPLIALLTGNIGRLDDSPAAGTSSAQVRRLMLLKAWLHEAGWRGRSVADWLVGQLTPAVDHPYKQVRHVIGETLTLCSTILSQPPRDAAESPTVDAADPHPSLVAFVNSAVQQLDSLSGESLTPAQIAQRTRIRETLVHWLSDAFKGGHSAPLVPLLPQLLPVVFAASRDQHDQELTQMSGTCSALIMQAPVHRRWLAPLLRTLESIAASPNWHTRAQVLPFMQVVVFNHAFLLTPNELDGAFRLIVSLCTDPQIEVREVAQLAVGSLVQATHPPIQPLIDQFTALAGPPVGRRRKAADTEGPQNMLQRHGGIVGLCGIVQSSPYDVPEWLPSLLVKLASYTSDPAPISESVRKTFAEFWRTHQDMWEEQREKFTDDQLEAIQQISTPSYYT